MTNFKIFETARFLNDLKQDFGGQRERIKKKLLAYVYPQSRRQPYFGGNIKKLRDYVPPTWRYRIGDYRFFYSIDDRKKTVFMLTADNRADLY